MCCRWSWAPRSIRRRLAASAGSTRTSTPLGRRLRRAFRHADLEGDERIASYFLGTEPEVLAGLFGERIRGALAGRSPLDPLLYGFIGVRALAHIVLDQPAEAALWGERAARAPRAHPLIDLIAAVSYELAGDHGKAKAWAGMAMRRQPSLTASDFLHAFPFHGPAERRRVIKALERLDLGS